MEVLKTPNVQTSIRTGFPLINAVISNLQEGEIYNGKNIENLYYIIHKAGFSYLTKMEIADYSGIFDFFVESKRLPLYFHIYDPPPQLISICIKENEKVNCRVRKRVQLSIRNNKLEFNKPPSDKNYAIRKINHDNFNQLSIFNLHIETKFWKSSDDFLKNGFGFCAFDQTGSPASICYTACVSNETAEIDVATLPAFQNRGLAKSVVSEFVQYSNENNIVANWDCFEDNYASLKTAESLGFRYGNTYNFLSIFNKSRKS